jgi:REP element-mobilizing transposase RayT
MSGRSMPQRYNIVTAGKADKRRPQRQSTRLRGYDYTQCGAYFVTICAWKRRSLFGEVVNGEMHSNALGDVVAEAWLAIPMHFRAVELDTYTVMPNHAHGIVVIAVAAQHAAPSHPPSPPFAVAPGSLGAIVRSFKSAVTKRANEIGIRFAPQLWQRNYYEHVIRNDDSLGRIREYIAANPARWELDAENPQPRGVDEFDRWLATFKTRPHTSGARVMLPRGRAQHAAPLRRPHGPQGR